MTNETHPKPWLSKINWAAVGLVDRRPRLGDLALLVPLASYLDRLFVLGSDGRALGIAIWRCFFEGDGKPVSLAVAGPLAYVLNIDSPEIMEDPEKTLCLLEQRGLVHRGPHGLMPLFRND